MGGAVCFLSMVTGAVNHLSQLSWDCRVSRVTESEGTGSWDAAQRDGFRVREECGFVHDFIDFITQQLLYLVFSALKSGLDTSLQYCSPVSFSLISCSLGVLLPKLLEFVN